MSYDLTWEIGVLLNDYVDKIKSLEAEDCNSHEKYRKKEVLEELYAQAIELTAKDNCGLIMPIDDFIGSVKCGSIMDYDGCGYLINKDGERIGSLYCNVSFLLGAKDGGAIFVAWYNK